MDYGRLPKGLLEFHAYPDGSRSPFEEHLVEAASVVTNADGACRVHFTVSPDHVKPFESLLGRVREKHETALDTTFQVEFSTQQPSTDTVAVDSSGLPFRRADGGLLFRPSGHGALLENLGGLDAEWIWMKNIDNTVPDHLKPATHRWARALLGFGARRRRRTELPDRPVRVCGMVRNTGEPGGGPFWVRDAEGHASAHIVETAEIDPDAPEQRQILARSTHFNPVFMVCGLADRQGASYDLRNFVDPDRAIVTEKSFEGRALRALELPGLWNGSMAMWDTVFVEVPGDVFNPVKTVNDLLRDEHQPAVP
jgi:hypothetical protein